MSALLLLLLNAAAPPEDAFQAFRDGRFDVAHARFREVLASSGAGDGSVCVNLGRCAERLGRPAEALWWLERARLRRPRDAELATAIERLDRRLGLRSPPPADPLDAALQALRRLLPGERALLGYALEWLALAALVVGFRRRAIAMAAVCLLVVAGALVAGASGNGTDPRRGVVLRNGSALRSEPHREVAARLTLKGGARVVVLGASDRWAHVRHDRTEGWIEAGELGVIE